MSSYLVRICVSCCCSWSTLTCIRHNKVRKQSIGVGTNSMPQLGCNKLNATAWLQALQSPGTGKHITVQNSTSQACKHTCTYVHRTAVK
jgi:hypothetical protein